MNIRFSTNKSTKWYPRLFVFYAGKMWVITLGIFTLWIDRRDFKPENCLKVEVGT